MNGVVNSVVHVVRHLRDRGIPVLVIAPDAGASREFEGVPVERVRSIVLPGVPDFDVAVASAATVGRILGDFQPSVVHLASPFVLGSRVHATARTMGIPTVSVFQTDIAGYAQHYGMAPLAFVADAVMRRIHGGSDVNLVPSHATAEYLERLGAPQVRMWRRGVDLELFSPQRRTADLRAQWGADGRTIVGYLGRLAPEKSVHTLAALDARRDVRVVIVGDGPSRAELAEQLPNAVFTGRLSGVDLGAAAASFDVLVAPGEKETFCQVVQEGMACGVPVVAPAVGGPLDLIEHDRTGLLYRAGDAAGMTASVLRLADDALLRRRLADAGRAQVAERSWSALVDELIGHYGDAMGARMAAAA